MENALPTVATTEGRRYRRLFASGMMVVVAALGVGACGSGDNGGNLGKTADIVYDNQGVQPKTTQVKAGQEVVFSVLNKDSRPHTFTLPYLDIDKAIPPGQRIDVKLKVTDVPPAGFYSFYSNDHQAEGYQGQIKVVQ